MTPPEASVSGHADRSAESAPAVSVCAQAKPALRCVILQKRADFLRAASARRAGAAGFLLQGRARKEGEPCPPEFARVGFTCSKKLGNAVARNRAKRRLREVARLALAPAARAGWDYVLVGRPNATATRDFAALLADLAQALAEVHSDRPQKPRPDPSIPRGPRRGK